MKKILSMFVLGAVLGISFANVDNVAVAENNFQQEFFAGNADKEKMLDDKLRKQAEKKRAEQLEKKAKG